MGSTPIHFHPTHGTNIALSADKSRAIRVDSFCKGICFSDRPVAINERVYVKFSDISTSWNGAFRFGFTSCDPASVNSAQLPDHACPDLTNKPGYWADVLPQIFAKKDAVLSFYVTRAGDVMYGVDGQDRGRLFSGVSTSSRLWAIIDVYGNTVSVEFVGESSLTYYSCARLYAEVVGWFILFCAAVIILYVIVIYSKEHPNFHKWKRSEITEARQRKFFNSISLSTNASTNFRGKSQQYPILSSDGVIRQPSGAEASAQSSGVDRWGTGGDASPHFSAWGDSIGIVPPPLFSSEKLRGI